MNFLCGLAIAILGLVTVSAASAQTEAPQAAVTTSYDAWIVRCLRQPVEPGSARSLCEMAQIVLDRNRQMVAQVVLVQRRGTEDWQLVAQIPVNVSVTTVVQLNVEGIDPIQLPLQRCVGNSCIAELNLDESTMGRLRQASATSPASIEYVLGNGGDMKMPFSLQGFTVAFNALSTQ